METDSNRSVDQDGSQMTNRPRAKGRSPHVVRYECLRIPLRLVNKPRPPQQVAIGTWDGSLDVPAGRCPIGSPPRVLFHR